MFVTQVRIDTPVEGYAGDLPVVRRLAEKPLELAQTTILTGDNGSGKSLSLIHISEPTRPY